MIQIRQRVQTEEHTEENGERGLQVFLWSIWTCAVAVTAYMRWQADVVAQRPVDILGLVIYCALVGVIGLIVMTKIEMHIEPWRFID